MAHPAPQGDSLREYEQARTGCVVFDQSDRGKVAVTGPEAARFLHNLTTQDVLNLPPGEGREGFAVTAKARVVAYFFLFHEKAPDGVSTYWLDLPPGTTEKTLQHLDRYRISEQADFADRGHDFANLHIAGPRAAVVLEKLSGSPLPPLQELQHSPRAFGADVSGVVIRHDLLGLLGFDILFPASHADTLSRRLTEAGATPAGREAYEMLRIEAGTPAFGSEIDENTFVPEVGRARQAICYTKGCYLGQEPIVMARDRGQINRTLLGLKLTGEPAPHGSLVYRDDKEVGRVTSCTQSPVLGIIALAYIRRGNQEPGTAVEVEVEGTRRPAVVSALPFADIRPGQ
jgi:tRNA-modifying protein YgfZ